MKKIFTIFAAIFIAVSMVLPEMANAQAPGKMSYQAVIRNSEGGLLANTQLGIQISILQGAATGTSVYSETQTPTTNSNGLVSIEIGGGEDFNAIDWGNGVYFIKTETDPAGGTDYSITGTSQIMSVPYALNAKTADNGITATQATTLAATSGTNTGDQDVSGIETNATAVSALQAEQTTQDAAIASNTAKSGITEEQAATLAATSGTNTGDQDISGIATNTAAIALNTAKVGLTTAQADIVANTSGINTGDQDITGIATNTTVIALNTANWNNHTVDTDTQLDSTAIANMGFVAGSNSYSVGDFAHGGIVFWIDSTGEHGLVCAKSDQASSIRWYAGTNGLTRASGDGLYSGKMNTTLIISSQVSIGDDTSPYAASVCQDAQIVENGITYGDWYLPSMYELDLIYQNKAVLEASALANGGTVFTSIDYWSSTELDVSIAKEYFFGGVQGSNLKSDLNDVRAIRRF
jgi:hypothetical protein